MQPICRGRWAVSLRFLLLGAADATPLRMCVGRPHGRDTTRWRFHPGSSLRLGSSAVPPVQVRAAGLAYVRSTRAWQLAENQRAPWKSAIFSGGWVRGATRSVSLVEIMNMIYFLVSTLAKPPLPPQTLSPAMHCRPDIQVPHAPIVRHPVHCLRKP